MRVTEEGLTWESIVRGISTWVNWQKMVEMQGEGQSNLEVGDLSSLHHPATIVLAKVKEQSKEELFNKYRIEMTILGRNALVCGNNQSRVSSNSLFSMGKLFGRLTDFPLSAWVAKVTSADLKVWARTVWLYQKATCCDWLVKGEDKIDDVMSAATTVRASSPVKTPAAQTSRMIPVQVMKVIWVAWSMAVFIGLKSPT